MDRPRGVSRERATRRKKKKNKDMGREIQQNENEETRRGK